ncbi:MAG: DUF6722 family protein [Campylobacterales bacterium]
MKKETLKEAGKYLFDVSKILIALMIIAPLVQDAPFSVIALIAVVTLAAVGLYLINKGAKDE